MAHAVGIEQQGLLSSQAAFYGEHVLGGEYAHTLTPVPPDPRKLREQAAQIERHAKAIKKAERQAQRHAALSAKQRASALASLADIATDPLARKTDRIAAAGQILAYTYA